MNIVEIYNAIEEIALGTKMIDTFELIKSDESIDELIKTINYRAILMVADSAALGTDDDSVSFSLTIIDKTKEDNSIYLQSINDGLAILRRIADGMNYNHNQRIVYTPPEISSGYVNNGLLTTINCSVNFEFDSALRPL